MPRHTAPFTGHRHTEATKAHISEVMRRRGLPDAMTFAGRTHSEEAKAKMRAAAARRKAAREAAQRQEAEQGA
jgi:hypothetical protein